MAARRQMEQLDEGVEEDGAVAGAWKLIVTETDEIDEIAERDAKKVSEKVREAFSAGTAKEN
jgi:hypothetical protein